MTEIYDVKISELEESVKQLKKEVASLRAIIVKLNLRVNSQPVIAIGKPLPPEGEILIPTVWI